LNYILHSSIYCFNIFRYISPLIAPDSSPPARVPSSSSPPSIRHSE